MTNSNVELDLIRELVERLREAYPRPSEKIMEQAHQESLRTGIPVDKILEECGCLGSVGNCPCIKRKRALDVIERANAYMEEVK